MIRFCLIYCCLTAMISTERVENCVLNQGKMCIVGVGKSTEEMLGKFNKLQIFFVALC